MKNYMLIRKVGSLNQMLGIYSSEIEARFIMNKCKKHYKGKIWYKMTITDITTAKVGNYLRKRNEKNIKRHEKQYTHIITENN